MTFKVFTDVSSSLLGRASYVALAFVLSTATVAAADKGKPADATAAATAPAAPAATLGLAPGEIPSDLDSAIRQAQMNRKNGDFAEASKILGQLVLFAPDDPRVLGEYGKTLAAQGRTDDALAFLERAIQLQPGEWTFYSAQGVAYDQKGNYQAAMNSYTRALALKPAEPTVLNNAALSRMQAGDLAGAENYLMQAAPGAAEFPRISENLALVESLKAMHPAPVLAQMPQPAIEAPAGAPMIANDARPSGMVTSASLPPLMDTSDPIMTASVAPVMPVMPAMQPIPSEPEAMPASSAPVPASKTLAQLKSDPTVRMAPVPKDNKAVAVKPAAPKPQAASAVAEAGPVAPKATPAARNAAASSFYVQAGAYATQSRADQTAAALDSLGARVQPATVDGHALFRVRIGPFLDIGQANAAVSHAQALGHTDLRIVSE